jgi:hypothetical protein
MQSRVIQVGLLIVLGGGLGWLLTREFRTAEPQAAAPAAAVESRSPAMAPTASDASKTTGADVPPPPVREFKLPTMRAPAPAPAPVPVANKEPPPPASLRVPKFWLLRGTAAASYQMLSDRRFAKSGEASVLIRARAKNLNPDLTGSVMQAALPGSLLGRRIEVSAFLRAEEVRERTVSIWLTALDQNNLLLAADNSAKQFPKITGEWTRVHFVIEVPWATAQVHFGATLAGPGAAWMDDLRLTPVDRTVVAVTNTALPRQLGQRVEVANLEGPRTTAENLDFEETTDIPAPAREADNLSAIRQ